MPPTTAWPLLQFSSARLVVLPTDWHRPTPEWFFFYVNPKNTTRATTQPDLNSSTHLEPGSLNPRIPNTRTKSQKSVEHTKANGPMNFEISDYKIRVFLQRTPHSKEKQCSATPYEPASADRHNHTKLPLIKKINTRHLPPAGHTLACQPGIQHAPGYSAPEYPNPTNTPTRNRTWKPHNSAARPSSGVTCSRCTRKR